MGRIKLKFSVSVLAILYSSDVNDLYQEENDVEVVEEISIVKENLWIPLTILCAIAIVNIAPQKAYASYLLLDKERFREEKNEYESIKKYLNSFLDKQEWRDSIRYRKFSKYTGQLIDFTVGTAIGLGVSYGVTRLGLGLQECKGELVAKNLKILSQSDMIKRYRKELFYLKNKECLSIVSCEIIHDSLLPKIIEAVVINMD